MHIRRGLRQAAVLLTAATVAAAAAGGLWVAVQGGGFWSRTGLVAMVLAGLVSVTGGTSLSRDVTTDARALLGAGPDREEPGSGQYLTAAGVFLLVSVPLFVLGGLLVSVR